MTIENPTPGMISMLGVVMASVPTFANPFTAPSILVDVFYSETLYDPAARCALYREAEAEERAEFLEALWEHATSDPELAVSISSPSTFEACVTPLVADCDDTDPLTPIFEQCLAASKSTAGGRE